MKTFLISIFLLIPILSYSASFDCKKARTLTEIAICSNPELSLMDEMMAFVYKDRLKLYGDNEKKEQLIWLKEDLFPCSLENKFVDLCIQNAYSSRFKDWEIMEGGFDEFFKLNKWNYLGKNKENCVVQGDIIQKFRKNNQIVTIAFFCALYFKNMYLLGG